MKYLFLFTLALSHFVANAQIISTFAGCGTCTIPGDGGPATAAAVSAPNSGAFDKYGNYYYAEILNQKVRKISTLGIISTVAGIGGSGGSTGDGGPATAARLSSPTSVILDTLGNLYIADLNNMKVRKVNITTGIITTIAGNGTGAFSGDGGAATAASLWGPQDICLDKYGNLYIADQVNIRVRKVSTAGIISTFAGNGGFSATGTGDGGAATTATFNFISGLVADDTGNIYIADFNAGKVRKVNTSGIISTFAGNGTATYIGDNIPATSAQFSPLRLGINDSGNIVIGDKYNRRVYRVDHSGILHTIAGNGATGYSGDGGPATAASIDFPGGIVFDACGNLYIPEVNDNRIRKVTFPGTAPVVTLSAPATAVVGRTVTVSATITGGCCSNFSVLWMNHGAVFATTTTPTVTYTKGASTDSITAKVIGCGDTTLSGVYVVSSSVGVASLTRTNEVVTYYPNPVRDELIVSSPEMMNSVVITNLLGQVVVTYNGKGEKDASIDVSGLAKGLYFLKVNNKYVNRFVKE
jgi:hypothetical protein